MGTPRQFTPNELEAIARIFYEITASRRATIYAGLQPIYTPWEHLPQATRDATISGLKERIDREGLEGYLERKRAQVGDALTNAIKQALSDYLY